MTKGSVGWLEAGKILSKTPTANVPCPTCEKANLTVRDERWSQDPSYFERYLTCPACGASSVIRMHEG